MQKTIQTHNTELLINSTLREFDKQLEFVHLVEILLACVRPQTRSYTDGIIDSKRELYFSLTICSDKKMKNLNALYRYKSKTTDVLSFPLYDNLRKVEKHEVPPGPVEIGDLFVSWPVCVKQAKEFGITPFQEFSHLFVHGYLHLLGFDHEISLEEEQKMQKEEERLIKKVYEKMDWVKK